MNAYAESSEILEYGSGGSTVYGAKLGKKIITVESDQIWLESLRSELSEFINLTTIYANIGRTKEWGHPVDSSCLKNFPQYAIAPWLNNINPDLVLIDGRFRPACFLATASYTKKEIKIIFDDYIDRPQYHFIESFFNLECVVGRAVMFTVKPNMISADFILNNINFF